MGTAIVSGSASGIGAAVRRRLEAQGDRVIGIDLRQAEIEVDLATADGRARAAAEARRAAGGDLERVVLCAGVGPNTSRLELVPAVNYFGAVELLDALREALSGRASAAAVAICSNSAQLGPFTEHPYVSALLDGDEASARALAVEHGGYIAYAGSKHALARALRRRAPAWGAAGVRLNGVAPGATETPMLDATRAHPVWGAHADALPVPLGRTGQPAEIAACVAFLLSSEAAFVHGSILYVDGGTDAVARPDAF